MALKGFGKDSGPSTTPRPQAPPVHFPRPPSPSPPHPRSPSDLKWVDPKASSIRNYDAQPYQRPPPLLPRFASSIPSTGSPAKTGQIQDSKRTRSPPSTFRADEISKNSRVFIEKPTFSSPVWVNRSKPPGNNNSSLDRESISAVWTKGGNYQSGRMSQTKPADVPLPKQTRSLTLPSVRGASPEYTFFPSDGHKRSPIDYRDLDAPEEMPSPPLAFETSFSKRDSSSPFTETENTFSSSPLWANQLKSSSSNTTPVTREGLYLVSTTGTSYQSRQAFQTKRTEIPLPKRTRSPTLLSSSDSFSENPEFALDDYERAPDSQSHTESSKSGQSRQTNNFEVPANNSLHFPVLKRAKLPLLPSSDQVFQENVDSAQEIERELHAKAKRLARFKDELSQPVQSNSSFKNQKAPAKRHQSEMEKQKSYEDPTMDVTADLVGRGIVSDYEGAALSSSIVGLCPDMCPESERAERERKGDLDHYERLDGDRNLSSKFLAVKKYTRTAEREAELIRPMPILEKTMDYLLNLLDQPYNDGFLGLYNFLWDRMRAIRMDLRMQHIFNLKAISMLEQMIRLHILAMHELCEYTKGEGFSEGFDAHLNIEQMNKTSVELFQFYDDHRKKGIHVPSEKEFRGYYALLKLDKHPGYKVEPAELSLDLAKMTPEMRQTPEVFFAREVARACRTCNFIAFFRLARKASYLQACLMHAHFSKLRTQALASLNSGLQINQGIPVNHVAKWLGMEEEDVDDLLDYYGFSVKEFEEPYMVKESALISVDSEYPLKCSKLVGRKRSKTIASDVLSPSLVDSHTTEELKVFRLKKDPEEKPTPLQFIVPGSIIRASDQEMHESDANLSPSNMPKHLHKTSIDLSSQGEQRTVYENQVPPASPLASDFCNSSSESHHIMVESAQKPKYDPVFRNTFGRAIKHDLPVTVQPITPERDEEKSPLILPIVSAVNAPIPQPMFAEHLEDEDQTGVMEEYMDDDAETSYYDREVAEAKLKLVLRIWKRRTAKKKEIREHKRSEANAALSSLSLGPPIWQYKVQSDTYGIFNIDHVTSMRREIQGRSWSVLNPSDVVAAKLTEKNPDAKCLCWKMILCSLEESAYGDTIGSSNESAYSWLQSKFMPASNNGDSDLLVSSPDLAIWKSWIPNQSGIDLICCLSVIKSTTFQDLNNAVTGASAVLFLLSENIPTELQKNRLDDVVMSLPSGSCLPLLILSGSGKDESDPSTIAKDLGLHDIDKSRVSIFSVSFLKDMQKKQLDGFFSDKRLRGGLEWLASESPPQIIIRSIKTRELVISHLNSTLKVLDEINAYRVDPNHCISSFNEALDRSMEEVVTAAHGNPTCWPCPEIDLLEEFSDEYRAATWYLPSRGWSTAARVDKLLCALNDSKLPIWEVDMSWLSRGLKMSDDVKNQKLQLENCLVMYLTETSRMMGVAMAKKEASTVLQRCARLELHNSTYHIVPSWVKIFRRVFSWRLMSLTIGEVSSTHVLVQRHISTPTSEIPVNSEPKVQTLLPSYINHPSLDELVEVGCNMLDLASIHMEHQALQPLSPMASDDDNIPIISENAVLMENENKEAHNEAMVASYDHSTAVINKEGQLISSRSARESDTLSELLEKCNIVQNKIDKKLSIYF